MLQIPPVLRVVLTLVSILTAAAALVAMSSKPPQAPLMTRGSASPAPWQRYDSWTDKRWDSYATLAELKPVLPPAAVTINGALNGDAEKGKELAFDRSRGGSCVACHILGPQSPELPGNVGPDLSTIGAQRSEDELYRYIHDARSFNPVTVMPPWGTHGVFDDQEIRDIVAFLKTLVVPMKFKQPLDDPQHRPTPQETRDNLDSFENPAVEVLDEAKTLFNAKGPKGKACLDCHQSPEQQFKTWAASMPRYEPRMKKVLGVEEFITRHALATTGAKLLMSTRGNVVLSVYLHNLANGTPIQIDVKSPAAKVAAERGHALMQRKIGQLNFACTDCHQTVANHWIRGQWLTEAKGQTAHFPTWRTSRHEIWDLRKRFQWCNVAIRANELAPDAPEYGDLELYLASLSNGMALNVPGIRH